MCLAPGRFAISSDAETGIANRLGRSSQHLGSFPGSVNLWFQLPTFWGGGYIILVARSQWWHLHLSPGFNAFSVFAVDQSLSRLLVWERPKGMGGGTYLILSIEKRIPGGRKRCVCCASSRFPHSSGRPLRAYVFAGNAGYLMFLVNLPTFSLVRNHCC